MNFRRLNALLWGNSVALAWMWGLGLFFSVQMTFMFGLRGLLLFAVPNAAGLMLFGFLTQIIASNHAGGRESLAIFFDKFAKPFRLIFYLYQILALTLTVFALVRYLFVPLQLASGDLFVIYLCLIVFVLLAAGCLFGEEFGIQKIKYSHALLALLMLGCIGIILCGLQPFLPANFNWSAPFPNQWTGPTIYGYAIPLIVGLLVGPWLDLQHWQRAIQIHQENASIRLSYFFGGGIFFLLLLFHGYLALWVMDKEGAALSATVAQDGFKYAHDLVTRYFISNSTTTGWMPLAYFSFLSICTLTTLDSGYIALKWFLGSNVEKSQNMLVSLVPKQMIGSPIPSFMLIGIITLVGIWAKLELEYFMVAYASFFVGYAALAIARCFVPNSQQPLPQIRMFSMAGMSIVIFAFGYLNSQTPLLFLGSLLPLVYGLWLVFNTDLLRVATQKAGDDVEAASEFPDLRTVARTDTAVANLEIKSAQNTHTLAGHFEGKWFVYSMVATYADTNSVGNVYFSMYPMFVGKTRELFFNATMPDFDLKTTKFYILTRTFEHKFVREAREFDTITVKIRIAEYNRKFCTLEHQIFNSDHVLLGKGKQSLLFVSSKDFSLLDIPPEVYNSFIRYA